MDCMSESIVDTANLLYYRNNQELRGQEDLEDKHNSVLFAHIFHNQNQMNHAFIKGD